MIEDLETLQSKAEAEIEAAKAEADLTAVRVKYWDERVC